MFVGFNVTFMPQHIVGFLGMTRRLWTYESGLGWTVWNVVSSAGSGLLGLGVMVSVVSFALAWRRGTLVDHDPWRASTLEWSLPSPPPNENFANQPIVAGTDPRWEAGTRPHPLETAPWYRELSQPPEGQREAIVTTPADAEPQAVVVLPGHSLWPLWLTVGILILLVGVLFDLVVVAVLGTVAAAASLIGWLLPDSLFDARRAAADPDAPLPASVRREERP
jgi:cytochrome c oxidase subunit 1/cytochrome c oxidase subunit I+III